MGTTQTNQDGAVRRNSAALCRNLLFLAGLFSAVLFLFSAGDLFPKTETASPHRLSACAVEEEPVPESVIKTGSRYSEPQSARRIHPLSSLRKTLKTENPDRFFYHNAQIQSFLLILITLFSGLFLCVRVPAVPVPGFYFPSLFKAILPVRAGPPIPGTVPPFG